MKERPLVIAILAKSVGHILPFYLESILAQTEISSNTIFYIRTNDNRDNTSEILKDFYKKWSWKYKMVFDDSSIDSSLLNKGNHDWDVTRYKILGKIRKDSCDFAISENADYFIADADNICLPNTISSIRSTGLGVVAPMLTRINQPHRYSNYHETIDENGYFLDSEFYDPILYRKIKGLIEVPVVHCTYYISNNILNKICYDDFSNRMEYVIFSDTLRKLNVPQYIDNRQVYGSIFFSTNKEEFDKECEYNDYQILRNSIPS